MKVKVSISMDEETIKKVEERLQNSVYRNKSHLVEHAVKKLLENDKNN